MQNQTVLETARGPVIIRPTREQDAAALRELRLEALQRHPEVYGGDYESDAARSLESWQAAVRAGAGGPAGISYVAESGSQLVGMARLVRETQQKLSHSANIYSVYIGAGWRGVGLGDALMQACLDWAQQQGVRLVKLSVVTTNASATRLYLRCGFSIYGVEPEVIFWNGRYYDELLMVRRLPAAGGTPVSGRESS